MSPFTRAETSAVAVAADVASRSGAAGAARETLWLFPKHEDSRLSTNFALREFHCRCTDGGCFMTLVHPKLVETLQTLRDIVARPLVLNSAFRCRAHNERVGGRARSFHLQGMAADIACASLSEIEEVLEQSRRIPAVGGLGSNPGKGYVHLDVRRRTTGALVEWSE